MKTEVLVPLIMFCALAVPLTYWWLKKSGKASQSVQLPKDVEIVNGPRGPVFRGTATALLPVITEIFRLLAHKPIGSCITVGKFIFRSSNEIPIFPDPVVVVLPPDAWNIVASKFVEVSTGWEDSPFYFGDCGYLTPCPEPDIGIELVGNPLEN